MSKHQNSLYSGPTFTITELEIGVVWVLHEMVYSDCEVIVTVWDPDLVFWESPGPETVHARDPPDTSVELQVMTDVPPIATRAGDAEMVACGWRTVTLLEAEADIVPSVHVIW